MRPRAMLATTLIAAATLARPAAAGDAALAEGLFQQGKLLQDQGKQDEACAKFEASLQAEPSGGAALAYGRCRQLQGKTATAWAEYTRAATLFKLRGDAKRETFAREQAAALEPTLSTLTIEVGSADVEVRRDGVLVAPGAFGEAVPADPGEHRVEARADGYATWSTVVTVGPDGAHAVVQVPPLEKLPDRAVAEPGGVSLLVAGSLLGGLGAASMIAGGALGAVVLADASDAEDDPALCGNAQKICSEQGFDQIEEARDKALASNVLIGVGAAALVAGGALLTVALVDRDDGEPTTELTLAPAPAARGPILSLRGRF